MGSTSQNAGAPDPASPSGYQHDEPAPIQPGWLVAFVVAALIGQVAAALSGTDSTATYLASCAVLAVVVVLALVLPRLEVSSWVQLLVPGGYLVALALLFKSQASVSSGLQSLILLPIGWAALYHRLPESLVLIAGVVVMLVVTSLGQADTVVIVRRAGLWGITGTIIVLGAHNLRRWLGAAVAEGEEALRQANMLGDVARELNSTLDPGLVVTTGVRVAAEIASPPGQRARRANYCRIADGIVTVEAEFDVEGGWAGASWPLEEHPLLARAVNERVPTSGPLDPAQLGPTVRELADTQGVGHGAWFPVVVSGELHGVLAVAGAIGRSASTSSPAASRSWGSWSSLWQTRSRTSSCGARPTPTRSRPSPIAGGSGSSSESAAAGARSWCSRSTSTGSSTSTIATATPPGTSCC